MSEPKIDKAVTINGRDYLTIKDFAELTNRSVAAVRQYMSLGNRIRKLKVTKMVGRPLIPVTEVCNFPFTMSGRNTEDMYNYRVNNETGETYIIRAKGYCNAPDLCIDPEMNCDRCSFYKKLNYR